MMMIMTPLLMSRMQLKGQKWHCEHCGIPGHTQNKCWKLQLCNLCKKYGHPTEICREGCQECSNFFPHLKSEKCEGKS